MNVFDQVWHMSAAIPLTTKSEALSAALAILQDPAVATFLASPHVLVKDKVQVLMHAKVETTLIASLLEVAQLSVRYTLNASALEELLVGCLLERQGVPLLRIELVKPVDESTKKMIEEQLQKKLFPQAKKCTFLYSYNEKLLGGILVRHLDQVRDASWLYFLTALKEAATSN